MTTAGDLDDRMIRAGLGETWRPALVAAPRRAFVPDRVWRAAPAGGWVLLDRAAEPGAWDELVHDDEPIATQLDDGEPGGLGLPTSSTSQPSLVAEMLALADPRPGHRVLEIGTGTGWHAALLAARVGDDAVTTVEIDRDVAGAARKALAAAGRAPALVVGDGADGHRDGAPYDRVIATAGVSQVPAAWITQARPGAVIVLPYTLGVGGLLLRLVVDDDGRAASGRFGGDAAFMALRAQRRHWTTPEGETQERPTLLDPLELDDRSAARAVALAMPEAMLRERVDENGYYRITVHGPGGTWAEAVSDLEDGHVAFTAGPRDLWADVERAYRRWADQGRPSPEEFGLTVDTAAGREHVWLRDRANVWAEVLPSAA